MNKTLLALYFVLYLLLLNSLSEPLEIGLSTGYTIAQKDFGLFWENSINGGFFLGYPLFHPDFPCYISVIVSNHSINSIQTTKNGFLPATKNVLLIHTKLSIQYNVLKRLKTTPFVCLGIVNNNKANRCLIVAPYKILGYHES